MAEGTSQFAVSSLQFKVGQLVIKGVSIQIDNISLTPLVFCVTVLAILCQYLIQMAVITLALIDITLYIGMVVARETAARLTRLLQRLMTAFALLLEFGMPGDNRTGHQQKIQLTCDSA